MIKVSRCLCLSSNTKAARNLVQRAHTLYSLLYIYNVDRERAHTHTCTCHIARPEMSKQEGKCRSPSSRRLKVSVSVLQQEEKSPQMKALIKMCHAVPFPPDNRVTSSIFIDAWTTFFQPAMTDTHPPAI